MLPRHAAKPSHATPSTSEGDEIAVSCQPLAVSRESGGDSEGKGKGKGKGKAEGEGGMQVRMILIIHKTSALIENCLGFVNNVLMSSKKTLVLDLAKRKGVLRPRDLKDIGVSQGYLSKLEEAGDVQRVGRGLYMLPKGNVSGNRSLVEVATLVPQAVICLLSALQFHEIGKQAPYAVWIAIPRKSWKPTIPFVPTRVIWITPDSLRGDIEIRQLEGTPVQFTTPVRTVIDCWKFRNKVGMEIAIEALNDALKKKLFTSDELYLCAKKLRVWNVMKPYLQVNQ